jgi:hypothetical protein
MELKNNEDRLHLPDGVYLMNKSYIKKVRMKKTKSYLLLIIIYIILQSCDAGLKPHEKAYLAGTITYKDGTKYWPYNYINPAGDSVYDVRVVTFKTYPPVNIVSDILNGNAWFTNSLPKFVESSNFSLQITNYPIELQYIVVAMQYGPNIFQDWKVIGVYTLTGNNKEHSAIIIKDPIKYNISIDVDFNNLPPQPF